MILQLKIVIIVFATSIALGAMITSIAIYMGSVNQKTTTEQETGAEPQVDDVVPAVLL